MVLGSRLEQRPQVDEFVKIDVLCTRELNFEGSGGSDNRQNLRRFFEGVKNAPLEEL